MLHIEVYRGAGDPSVRPISAEKWQVRAYIVPVSVQQLCASQAVAHYLAAVVDDELDSQLLHGFAQKPRPSYLLTRSWLLACAASPCRSERPPYQCSGRW